jgi:hypothetical protein
MYSGRVSPKRSSPSASSSAPSASATPSLSSSPLLVSESGARGEDGGRDDSEFRQVDVQSPGGEEDGIGDGFLLCLGAWL